MAKVLVINSSVRLNSSVSRELTGILANRIRGESSDIIHRDLTEDIQFISEQSLNAVDTQLEQRTAEQDKIASLSDLLIEELEIAEYIIIGSPMYNFGPPASLKAWADLVARANRTFKYTDSGPLGLLRNKKAFIITVTGGTTVNSDIDFMTPWLLHFLAFLGITEVETISANGIFGPGGNEKIQLAKEKIDGFNFLGN